MGTPGNRTGIGRVTTSSQPKELVRPPRDVPHLVRWANLFGGFHNQFGWLWLGITAALGWFFLPFADFEGLYRFRGPLETAEGTVVASREANLSINDTPVYGQDYRFVGPDGVERKGTSYATGEQLPPGTRVTIEFPAGRPEISRIRGMRRGKFPIEGWVGVLVLGALVVFVGIGLGFLVTGLRRGLRANRLLAAGELALGRLKSREATSTQINNRTVWKFTFEFEDSGGRTHEAMARTHLAENLSDAAGEYLVYDPLDPSCAAMIDHMPGGVVISESGELEAGHAARAIAALLVPGAVVSVHALIAYFVLLYPWGGP